MPAYCDVDGVPCHASHELLTTILRDEWGFDGIVASDYIGIEMLATAHRLTADLGDGGRAWPSPPASISELPRTVAYRRAAGRGARRRRVDEALLDAAVGRILRMKFRLGLFERPYVDDPTDAMFRRARGRGVAARRWTLAGARWSWSRTTACCRSRRASGALAVIGPIADSARDLLGDYSHLVHMETLLEMRTGGDALGVSATARCSSPATS